MGAFVLLDAPFGQEAGGVAARYVPADGAASRYTLQDGNVRTAETARIVGVVGAITGPDAVNAAVIGALGDDVGSASYWRQLTTTADAHYTDLFVLAEDGLRQMASWGGPVGFTFDPGLLLLPADVRPGATWSSEGSALANGALTFASEFTASAADEQLAGVGGSRFEPRDGCIRVDGTLTIEQPGAGVLLESRDTSIWCESEGVVFSVGEQNGAPVGSVRVEGTAELPAAAPPTEPATDRPATAAGAAPQPLDTVVVDPLFGDTIREGSMTTAPARTSGGLVVTANEHGDDLLAWRLEEDRAVLAWMAHPGGTIATVSAVEHLVLAATQDRAIRAYDEQGRRLWSWTGDDLVLAPAVAAPGSTGLLVATRGGTVAMLRSQDGREEWSRRLGADVRGALATAGGAVALADERGRVTALDTRTGGVRWQVDAGMSAALGGSPEGAPGKALFYLVTADGEVLALDAATGETVWEGAVAGTIRAIVGGHEGVTVVSDEQAVRFSAAGGARQWRASGGSAAIAAAGDRVLTLTGRVLALLGPDGTAEADWRLPDSSDPVAPRLLDAGTSVLAVGPALELWRWELP
ncbi:MAG: hypothetical protein JWR33_1749 [Naasia sp.]|jgi:outer membrane protein assembly factor BamB|nr:hypothetical protein [Naasia sp.]